MSNSLKHVGVLGMRWGVRRSKSVSSEDHIRSRNIRKKKLNEMTNEEIRTAATRASLEKQYRDLTPGKFKRATKTVDGVLTTMGKVTAAAATVTAAAKIGKSIYDRRAEIRSTAEILIKARKGLS